MEHSAQDETLDLEVLESRLEMESVAALAPNIVNSTVCHCSILVPPSSN
ncbi:MAG: hypothetical protein KGH90_00545 [Xanthomonadaceae bacterium]|jgi:hypothetical protein|nr:hypothetical protein [Xanthomonadaceae bacterium]